MGSDAGRTAFISGDALVMSESTRDWGPWSVWKTELILGAYLPAFLRAGRSSRHRVFIDGFAGSVDNFERDTGRPMKSSPVLALEEIDPGFTHLVFHELPDKAESLGQDLRRRFGDRRFKIIPGDCNDTIGAGLTWLSKQGTATSGPHLGQILAYLDPDNHTQLRWETIENLATVFRQSSRRSGHVRRRPIELLVLFPILSMKRCLPTASGTDRATGKDIASVNAFFGSNEWQGIYEDQREGIIAGNDSWRLYVDLFRAQLEDLGYRHVVAIETRNTKNGVLYYMVSASDSSVGATIMRSVLSHASELFPKKIEDAKKLKARPGAQPLFDPDEEKIAFAPDRYAALLLDPPIRHEPGSIESVKIATPRRAQSITAREDRQERLF